MQSAPESIETADAAEDRARRRAELRGVIRLTVPFVIATSARAVMDVADYAMITALKDPASQAAILPAQMIMFVCIVFGTGVVSMVATFAAQALGRETHKEAAAYTWQSLYLSGVFGLISLALIPAVPEVVRWMGHEAAVQVREIEYARIALLTMGPSIAMQALGYFFNGIHRPAVTMWSALEANVVNVAVSGVLIFGLFGAPSMGIAGAAWGTLVAVLYRCVRLGFTLLNRTYDAIYATRSTWRWSRPRMLNLLRVGVPTGLHFVNGVAVWAIFATVLIGRTFGTEHQIATNTAWQYMRVSLMPTMGIGFALTSLVGRSIGAGDWRRAMRQTRITCVVTCLFMGAISLIYAVFGRELIALFTDQPEVVRIGAGVMVCVATFQLLDAISITYESALRGAGDTFWPSLFFVLSHWMIVVGGGWVVIRLAPGLESLGPWIAAATLILVCAVFGAIRWHAKAWLTQDIFRDGQQSPADLPAHP